MGLKKISALMLVWIFLCSGVLFSCNEENKPAQKQAPAPAVVSGTVSRPLAKPDEKTSTKSVTGTKELSESTTVPTPVATGQAATPSDSEGSKITDSLVMNQDLKYTAKADLDPFSPLVREEEDSPVENQPVKEEEPKRILTPLEKMDLGELRLVAVIETSNKKMAMVEEATGKGYEVGIGTYMGKNSGRVAEITPTSIIIKEIVKDYKGKRKERFQEMKLHKRDDGE